MKLNLGSGYTHRPGFLRVDIDEKCEPDFLVDVRDLSEIPGDSVEEIYTAHTIEHILLIELFPTIRGFCRILKPGGNITVVVPDTEIACQDWINKRIKAEFFEKIVLGAQPNATPYMSHKQIFWPRKLHRFLDIAGFTDIQVTQNRDSYEIIATAKKPERSKHVTRKSSGRNR